MEEIDMAIEHEIGCFVVDNFYELELLEELCVAKGKNVNILLRVTPGIEAHTHDYILTGQDDSKFGFGLLNGQADQAVELALQSKKLNLLGIHCHIGSQIFETTGFLVAARKIFEKLKEWKETKSYQAKVLNLGGGFGIRYTEEDDPLPASQYVEEIITEVRTQTEQFDKHIA